MSDRPASPGRASDERRLERLQTGGPGRPIAIALGIVVVLVALVMQPWGRAGPRPVASASPGSGLVASPTTPGGRSPDPSASGERADDPVEAYVSLTDNEWTVVALLATDAPASTEEPATQHPAAGWSPDGPFHVLQQGLIPVVLPGSGTAQPPVVCKPPLPPREWAVVSLPAGRVAYFGVTFPGMDPRTVVSVARIGGTGPALQRISPLVVRLVGLAEGRRYEVPSSGRGGAIMFAASPPGILPSGVYRFEIAPPGITGRRLLDACVGS